MGEVRLNRGVCGSKEFDFARLRAQPASETHALFDDPLLDAGPRARR